MIVVVHRASSRIALHVVVRVTRSASFAPNPAADRPIEASSSSRLVDARTSSAPTGEAQHGHDRHEGKRA